MTKSTILYADDDLDDLFIVEQAFAPFSDHINLVHVTDGGSALSCLRRLCDGGQKPCLILLDMNMPVMDGRQALVQIRRTEEYQNLPVAVFTTSSSPMDKEFAKQWNAHFYTKPISFDDLQHLARTFINLCADEVPSK
jgi:CheY-like chemotaxis protein